MRLLFVEDDATFAREVEPDLAKHCDDVKWVRSRDAALQALAGASFDLVILDRKLPSADDVLDDHVDHGWRVFQSIRHQSPGTPVWFLTGTEDPDFAADINNEYGRTADLHGHGSVEQMYRVFWKRRIIDCIRDVARFHQERQVLGNIALISPADLQLTADECRVLKLYSRRNLGVVADVSSLNGGRSNSRVLKVVVKAADGRSLATAAAKVATLSETEAEAARYHAEISRLRPGGFPQLAATIAVGAGNVGGLFYGMVGDSVRNLFDKLIDGDSSASTLPSDLRGLFRPWYDGRQQENVPIAQIRRKFIRDTVMHDIRAQLDGINLDGIENRTIIAAACCQHRGLHCANVVFDTRGQAMLIDFGDTGASYAAADPVTLELSTVFHSAHSGLPADWPREENMLAWPDPSSFARGCRFVPFIQACREWAYAEAGSRDEVIAVGYAYALRQLKYQDTDKHLARALIRSCIQYFSKAGGCDR
jgi:CheY-like chemotaxis protein